MDYKEANGGIPNPAYSGEKEDEFPPDYYNKDRTTTVSYTRRIEQNETLHTPSKRVRTRWQSIVAYRYVLYDIYHILEVSLHYWALSILK